MHLMSLDIGVEHQDVKCTVAAILLLSLRVSIGIAQLPDAPYQSEPKIRRPADVDIAAFFRRFVPGS